MGIYEKVTKVKPYEYSGHEGLINEAEDFNERLKQFITTKMEDHYLPDRFGPQKLIYKTMEIPDGKTSLELFTLMTRLIEVVKDQDIAINNFIRYGRF